MTLKRVQRNWNNFGKSDPLWAILTEDDKRNNKWTLDDFFASGQREIDNTLAEVERLGLTVARGRALDFGCGAGRLTQALCQYFEQVSGVDIAPSMIELANQYNKVGERCRYYVNAAEDLKLFQDASFDFVYSSIVLQHMPPQYSTVYMREFMRVLAPGGVAVFQVPSGIRHAVEKIEALPPEAFNMHITILEAPTSLECGEKVMIRARVKNTSEVAWTGSPSGNAQQQISLGNHWLGRGEFPVLYDDGRSPIPVTLAPSEEVELEMVVSAPQNAGRYLLELDMVQENIGWFSDYGAQTARTTVNVSTWYRGILNIFDSIGRAVFTRTQPHKAPPIMEMYGVPESEVTKLIEESGAKLIQVREDDMAGGHWISLRYFVQKPT